MFFLTEFSLSFIYTISASFLLLAFNMDMEECSFGHHSRDQYQNSQIQTQSVLHRKTKVYLCYCVKWIFKFFIIETIVFLYYPEYIFHTLTFLSNQMFNFPSDTFNCAIRWSCLLCAMPQHCPTYSKTAASLCNIRIKAGFSLRR